MAYSPKSTGIRVSIGSSAGADGKWAGTEAARLALRRCPSFGARLAFVFGSSWFDQEHLLLGVRSVLKDVPIIGGSTAGEITPEGPASHSCVVVLVSSDTLTWSLGIGKDINATPRLAGQQAAFTATQSHRGKSRVGFLLFGDGLATGYGQVMRGIQEVLGTRSLIAGGMMGDDFRFAQTSQYFNHRVLHDSVVGVLLGGAVKMGVGIQHGFAPISKPRSVTRAKGNILHELDHQPAASVYEEYFGREIVDRMRQEGLTRRASAYPLGIMSDTGNQWLLRNVLSLQEGGSLLCSGEVPEQTSVQLMIGSKRQAIEAAVRAAQQAVQPLNRVDMVLVFDSAIRRKLLGEHHAAMELAKIHQTVGASIPLAGCYTYGEQGPLGNAETYGRTAVQTSSILIVAIGT